MSANLLRFCCGTPAPQPQFSTHQRPYILSSVLLLVLRRSGQALLTVLCMLIDLFASAVLCCECNPLRVEQCTFVPHTLLHTSTQSLAGLQLQVACGVVLHCTLCLLAACLCVYNASHLLTLMRQAPAPLPAGATCVCLQSGGAVPHWFTLGLRRLPVSCLLRTPLHLFHASACECGCWQPLCVSFHEITPAPAASAAGSCCDPSC